jgi:hypothetical protein
MLNSIFTTVLRRYVSGRYSDLSGCPGGCCGIHQRHRYTFLIFLGLFALFYYFTALMANSQYIATQ